MRPGKRLGKRPGKEAKEGGQRKRPKKEARESGRR
jgi:hypothetical protein